MEADLRQQLSEEQLLLTERLLSEGQTLQFLVLCREVARIVPMNKNPIGIAVGMIRGEIDSPRKEPTLPGEISQEILNRIRDQ